MESNASHMDQAWQAKLYDHAVPPPPAAWEGLSAALAEEKPVAAPASRALQRYVASAAVGLALLSGGWLNRDAPSFWNGMAGEVSVAEYGKTPSAAAMLPVAGLRAASAASANENGTKEPTLGGDQDGHSNHTAMATAEQEDVSTTNRENAGLAAMSMQTVLSNDAEWTEQVVAISDLAGSSETSNVHGALLAAIPQDETSDATTGRSHNKSDNPGVLVSNDQQAQQQAPLFSDPEKSLLPAADIDPLWAINEGPSSVRQGLYGGITAGMQLTALLSERKAMADINLDPGTSLGHAYGFALGYRWSEFWSAEANLLLDARQGAVYASTMARQNEEVDVTKRVQLIYTQVPLTVRYGGLRSPVYAGERPRGGPATVVGLQYGLLRNSRLAVGDKSVSPDRTFARHDLALLLGADYDIAVGQHGFFSLGLRGSLGLLRTRMTELDGVNSDKRNAVVGLRVAYNNWLSF